MDSQGAVAIGCREGFEVGGAYQKGFTLFGLRAEISAPEEPMPEDQEKDVSFTGQVVAFAREFLGQVRWGGESLHDEKAGQLFQGGRLP